LALRADILWVLLGRIATSLIAIASLRIMTTLLDPKDYGIYALLVAFQGFASLLLLSPVGQHINRHTHAWWDDGTLLKRLRGFNMYIAAVSAAIAIVVVLWWLLYPDTDNNIPSGILAATAVSAMVYLGTWNGTFVYILNMLGFRGGSVSWLTASSITGVVFSTILAHQYHTAMSWMLGQAFGMALGAIGAGLMLRRYQAERAPVSERSRELPTLLNRQTILEYCLPLAVAAGLMWLQNNGYRFLVGGVWGVAELGILVVGLSISSQLWSILESLAMQFLHPYFFRQTTEAKTDVQTGAALSDMVNVLWPLYAVYAGFNMIFAPSLLALLTNSRYHAAVAFVMLGALVEFARCTTNLWSYAAQVQRRTIKVIMPYGFGAIVVWLGAVGVSYVKGDLKMLAIILVIAGAATCVVMIVLMQRMLPVIVDLRRWSAGFAMLLISLAVVVTKPIQHIGLYQNAALLLLGVVFYGGCMAVLLWRNPALTRLLSVSLRST